MPGTKGNKNAVGNKGGRPTKYKEIYCKMLVEFFSEEPFKREITATSTAFGKGGNTTFTKEEYKYVANRLPSIIRFADKIGVSAFTIYEWADKHVEFSVALDKARELYKNFLIENGLMGTFNATFAMFVAKNTTDMKDKIEVEHNVSFIEAVRQAAALRAEREKALLQSGT